MFCRDLTVNVARYYSLFHHIVGVTFFKLLGHCYKFFNNFFHGSFIQLSPTSPKIWWDFVVYYRSWTIWIKFQNDSSHFIKNYRMPNGRTYKIHVYKYTKCHGVGWKNDPRKQLLKKFEQRLGKLKKSYSQDLVKQTVGVNKNIY